MAGENTAFPVVTTKAGSIIAEGLKLSLATPGGGLTPGTLTAMVGIAQGQALTLAPEVLTVMGKLSDAAGNVGGKYPASVVTAAAAAQANLTSLQSQILPSGNYGAFGSFLTQAQGHVSDSLEIQNATNFIKNSNFGDFGSGITSMSSMVDQGISSKLGNLSSVGSAITGCGKMFSMRDMENFGQAPGLINQIRANKLGNFTGLNKALASAGVDLNNLSDPVYSDTIGKVLGNFKDPQMLETISTQLEVTVSDSGTTTSFVEVGKTTSFGSTKSLNDFLDVKRVLPADVSSKLLGGFGDIGAKFKDLGASFASSASAKNMLNNLSLPNIPRLNLAAPNLNTLMNGNQSTIDDMIGKNLTSSPTGIPNITDFMGVVGGGGLMKQLSASTDISAIISGVQSQVSKSRSLINKAGIDLANPPSGLVAAKGFATSLHTFGADTSGSGISELLSNMANSNSHFGDAIKYSLAEGKNIALMRSSGIPPIDFSGIPIGEATKNLQQGKFIPGTGSMTQEQIGKIFGGG